MSDWDNTKATPLTKECFDDAVNKMREELKNYKIEPLCGFTYDGRCNHDGCNCTTCDLYPFIEKLFGYNAIAEDEYKQEVK